MSILLIYIFLVLNVINSTYVFAKTTFSMFIYFFKSNMLFVI